VKIKGIKRKAGTQILNYVAVLDGNCHIHLEVPVLI